MTDVVSTGRRLRLLMLGPVVVEGRGPDEATADIGGARTVGAHVDTATDSSRHAMTSRRDRIVLSVLVLGRGEVVTHGRLADAIWNDLPPASAMKVIHGCVARLRRLIGTEAISTSHEGYRLELNAVGLDIADFETGVVRARELVALRQYDRAAFLLDRALALWRGTPLPDLEDWEGATVERARLEEVRRQAEELHVEAMIGAGDVDRAEEQARTLAEEGPLRERRWLQLARAAYLSGHREDALAALRRCRQVLREELGLDPSSELEQLQTAILRRELPEIPAGPDLDLDECPWPGLESYGVDDAETYFGRDSEVRSALVLLRARGVLAVVGPSGIGKSSFVRAGLVPELAREGLGAQVITPGHHPPSTLPSTQVLVVDQCEEVFTLCDSVDERAAFLAALEDHVSHGLLVLALRADRMPDVTAHPALARLIEQGLYLLGALTDDGLRAAIERPAALTGLRIEPGLVDVLLRDVGGEPGALPMLSHALVETWRRREGRTLTVDGYRAAGGVESAVATSAESLYADLAAPEQAALRSLMMRLVSPGPRGEPIRARVDGRALAVDDVRRRLLERLVVSRLVTSDADVVTLAHEALASAWPRLRAWLDDDVEGRRVLHHLAASAAAWEALGRPESELYRGVRLARALDWRAEAAVELTATEQSFLEACQAQAEAEEASATAEARRQAAVNRRLRAFLVAAVTALVLALTAGALAYQQSRRADAEARTADARRASAKALTLEDPAPSILLATAAARLDPGPETQANLEAALGRRPALVRTTDVPSDSLLNGMVVSSDASSVYVADRMHVVRRVGAAGHVLATYDTGKADGPVDQVPLATSRATGLVAVSATPVARLPVVLLDEASLTPVPDQLPGWPDYDTVVASLSTSRDGRYLAATLGRPKVLGPNNVQSTSTEARVWDLTAPGRPLVKAFPVEGDFATAVLSADGRTLYTSGSVAAFDVRSGRKLWSVPESLWSTPLVVRPQGDFIALPDLSSGPGLLFVDARSGREVARVPGHEYGIFSMAISADGSRIVSGGYDGHVLVWDAVTHEMVRDIDVGGKSVSAVALSADGTTLWSAIADPQVIRTWDLGGDETFIKRLPDVPSARAAMEGGGDVISEVDPAGTKTANLQNADEPTPTKLWFVDLVKETSTSAVTERLPSEIARSWSPDGSRFALGYGSGVVVLYDPGTGAAVLRRTVLPDLVTGLSHSRDGRHLVAADVAGHVVRLDARTLEPEGEVATVAGAKANVAALPDGRRAVVTAGPAPTDFWQAPIHRWFLLDLASGRIEREGDTGVSDVLSMAVAPDGARVAFGGRRSQVAFVDLGTGLPIRSPRTANVGHVFSIRFDATGNHVVSGSTGNDAALWDARTGLVLARARFGDTFTPIGPTFRPDGSIVAAAGDQTVHIWNRSLDHAISYACRVVGRDLSRSEWADEFPERPWQSTCPA